MNRKLGKNLLFIISLILGIIIWGFWIVITHPAHAIVSWDEGFHGGAAFFISQSLRDSFSFSNHTYILNDFMNGMIWYPPLWLFLAGPLGLIFHPSVELYRLATLVFAGLSIFLVAMFAKSINGRLSGLIAGTVLAFSPTFIVYSHLMMREVPLLFAVSLAIIFFFRYLTKEKLTRFDYFLTLTAFVVGVLGKIIGIVLIIGTLVLFGFLLHIFFKDSRERQRFYSKWTIYFFVTSVVTFLSWRHFVRSVLNADPLLFHLNQTKDLSGENSNLLISLMRTFYEHFAFYLKDFFHMPALSIFWFGSLVTYLLVKKNPLSYLLVSWFLVTYFVFSLVKPQAPQYILTLFVPLALGTGLIWGEFLKYRDGLIKAILFTILILGVVWMEVIHLNKTETIGWRTIITNQDSAALLVADKASFGDRVISVGDGTRFLIRLFGDKQKLQTINGAAKICPDSIQDSTEWAISDIGQQNPIVLEDIKKRNWINIASFSAQITDTSVWRNINNTKLITLDKENLVSDRCIRIFLPGKNEFIIYATPNINHEITNVNEDLKIYLKPNILKIAAGVSIDQKSLINQSGKEQIYRLVLDQKKTNQPLFLVFYPPKNLKLNVRKIEILHKDKN